VKYEQEDMFEHQQTKELSREHKIFSLTELVLGCYDCFGSVTVMYLPTTFIYSLVFSP
jgi:hypothetical protein